LYFGKKSETGSQMEIGTQKVALEKVGVPRRGDFIGAPDPEAFSPISDFGAQRQVAVVATERYVFERIPEIGFFGWITEEAPVFIGGIWKECSDNLFVLCLQGARKAQKKNYHAGGA
jgi:hypothetical protein